MATTVIDSSNFQQFAAGETIEPQKEPPKEGEKAEAKPESKPEPEKIANETDIPQEEYELLTQKQQRAVNKKHRAMKEADEFAEEQYRERKAAERRAEEAEKRLRELETQAKPKEVAKKPEPKDFSNEKGEFDAISYAEALAKYSAEQAVQADRETRAQEAKEQAEQAAYQAYLARVQASAEGLEDWQEVAEGAADLVVSGPLTQYLRESDSPAPLLYHFAKNPQVLERLNGLSPIKAIAEAMKLETKLAEKREPSKAEAKAEKSEPPAKSRAPEPIAPLNPSSAPVHKDLKDMTTRETIEYWEARDKHKATRRQRH